MPTYTPKEDQTQNVIISIGGEVIVFPLGVDTPTPYIINDARLTLLYATPYANDALASQQVMSLGPGDDQEIELDAETDAVEIANPSTAAITVFRQSVSNTPGLPVIPNSVREISGLKHRTSLLILKFSDSASEIWLTQLRE